MKTNLEAVNTAIKRATTNLDTIVEALQRAGLRLGDGKHRRSGYTKSPLAKRRAKRRRVNRAAKAARKLNR